MQNNILLIMAGHITYVTETIATLRDLHHHRGTVTQMNEEHNDNLQRINLTP